jgi:hypothetical protein
MSQYKLFKNSTDAEPSSVLRTDDTGKVWSIPFALDNTDYQKYLEWVAEGNTPEPADA